MTTRPATAAAPIEYPSSDGKPMADNDAQRTAIMYGIGALTRHLFGVDATAPPRRLTRCDPLRRDEPGRIDRLRLGWREAAA